MTFDPRALLSLDDVAGILRSTVAAVHQLISRGSLVVAARGPRRRPLIHPDDLTAYLTRHRAEEQARQATGDNATESANHAWETANHAWAEFGEVAALLGYERGTSPDFGEVDVVDVRELAGSIVKTKRDLEALQAASRDLGHAYVAAQLSDEGTEEREQAVAEEARCHAAVGALLPKDDEPAPWEQGEHDTRTAR